MADDDGYGEPQDYDDLDNEGGEEEEEEDDLDAEYADSEDEEDDGNNYDYEYEEGKWSEVKWNVCVSWKKPHEMKAIVCT